MEGVGCKSRVASHLCRKDPLRNLHYRHKCCIVSLLCRKWRFFAVPGGMGLRQSWTMDLARWGYGGDTVGARRGSVGCAAQLSLFDHLSAAVLDRAPSHQRVRMHTSHTDRLTTTSPEPAAASSCPAKTRPRHLAILSSPRATPSAGLAASLFRRRLCKSRIDVARVGRMVCSPPG